MSDLWGWAATFWIVGVPCLWWQGIDQHKIQPVAWMVASFALVGLSGLCPRRSWSLPQASWLLLAVIGVSLITASGEGVPLLILYAGVAYLAFRALTESAPSAEWIGRRIVWLAVANAVYIGIQATGYDPLFDTSQWYDKARQFAAPSPTLVGFSGKTTIVGLILLVALPMAGKWQRVLLIAAALVCQSWTAVVGMAVLWGMRIAQRRIWREAIPLIAIACAWSVFAQWDLLAGKIGSRLTAWQEAFGQALWSPAWGWGLGHWEQVSGQGLFYNSYLAAFHVGGVLLLAPLLWVVWMVWKVAHSSVRTALLLLLAAGGVHAIWHDVRLVVVTLALAAALEIRRIDASG